MLSKGKKEKKPKFTEEEIELHMAKLMACGVAFNATTDKRLKRKIKFQTIKLGMGNADLTKICSARFMRMSNDEKTAFFEKMKAKEVLDPLV